ncbi:unannotated protein [freshwater metagenome]|uniref:Unannotated protein n=1 Tax=freshwater metagenome TaxID=449393 RepID=A0A6J7CUF9_9ZZZZ|nr:hypothetical protein [Actinomycetota bacterium]
MRKVLFVPFLLLVFTAIAPEAQAASCSDFANQAAAQRAANTRDADGDGIYCESLPCPCLKGGSSPTTSPAPAWREPANCVRPAGVRNISFSATKYPNIRRHTLRALRKGWPRILALNRSGTESRRARLLIGIPTRPGYDRDEYPPAVGRGRYRSSLTRGIFPTGWMAHVEYVPSSENRSHGSVLGIKLRRFCNGTRFRYVFY